MASEPRVLAVPYPGRGHVNPMMTICRLLAARGLSITFVVTEEWLGILSGAGTAPSSEKNISFITVPNVLPSETSRGTDFDGFFEAVFRRLGPPFELLLDGLDTPPAAILADIYLPWAVAAARRRNIPVFLLWTECASVLSAFSHSGLLAANHHLPAELSEEIAGEIVDCIPGVPPMPIEDLPSYFFKDKISALIDEAMEKLPESQGLLCTSFYELEPSAFDVMRSKLKIPILPIGPSIPSSFITSPSPEKEQNTGGGYFKWLDSQPRSSVLYVSLGSFLHVAGAQMEEIEKGLRRSGVRYLRVVRGVGGEGEAAEDGRGFVVPWCEQLKVLCHGSVGGFLTHCGWNSTMEGIYAGKPMLCFPLLLDQFTNSKLVADEWKIGMRLRTQSSGSGDGGGSRRIVGGEEISRSVARLMMDDGVESVEMRERARGLQIACRRALEEGGSSIRNLESFVGGIMAAGRP